MEMIMRAALRTMMIRNPDTSNKLQILRHRGPHLILPVIKQMVYDPPHGETDNHIDNNHHLLSAFLPCVANTLVPISSVTNFVGKSQNVEQNWREKLFIINLLESNHPCLTYQFLTQRFML